MNVCYILHPDYNSITSEKQSPSQANSQGYIHVCVQFSLKHMTMILPVQEEVRFQSECLFQLRATNLRI